MWNMFKVNNKNTRTMSLNDVLVSLFLNLNIFQTFFSSVSIVDFEGINVYWESMWYARQSTINELCSCSWVILSGGLNVNDLFFSKSLFDVKFFANFVDRNTILEHILLDVIFSMEVYIMWDIIRVFKIYIFCRPG